MVKIEILDADSAPVAALVPWPLQLLLAVTVLTAAALDVWFRRIPNWLTLSSLAAGLATNVVLGGPSGLLWSLVGAGIAAGLYSSLYALGAMGGGDVKLMVAAGSIVGPQTWLQLFFWTALCGGVFAAVTMFRRRQMRRSVDNMRHIVSQIVRFKSPRYSRPILDIRHQEAATTPHGVAIAAGTLILLMWR